MIKFDIITIFPNIFDSYFNESILKRAQQRGLIKIKIHNLRDWATDRHKSVDDRPYGGGPGMILKIEPIYKAIRSILKISNLKFPISKPTNTRIILLSADGKQFDQKMAYRYAKLKRIIFICGRYEGVDARVEKFIDEKISVGPYVLTGGELPAATIVDSVTRLIPGVIRKESLNEETFTATTNYKLSTNIQIPQKSSTSDSYIRKRLVISSCGEYPQYTRPEALTIVGKGAKIKKLQVPKVLLSGNHEAIKKWRG